MIKMVELFCGAGLIGEGFHQAGFDAIYAADLDKDAITSYNQNLSNKVGVVSNVGIVRTDLKCDVILAGPPCQGFSTLGKRDKKDERNKLSLLLLDWAKSTCAKVIVIENVPQFLNSEYHKTLVKEFKKMGYEYTSWVLNASEFNTPQNRKRSFTIFSLIGLPEQPITSTKKITVKEAFKGLNLVADADGMHSVPQPTALALERIKAVPRDGSKIDLMEKFPHLCPKSWFKMGHQAVDVWGRMHWNKPSNTIRCSFQRPSKGRYLHPTENRCITLREGARLQGIPDHWNFHGSKTSIARQIGNGVPIPLAKAVGESIVKLFN